LYRGCRARVRCPRRPASIAPLPRKTSPSGRSGSSESSARRHGTVTWPRCARRRSTRRSTRDQIGDIGQIAHRPAPGTRVALKTFHPHLVDSTDFARRFRREARTGARSGTRTWCARSSGSAKLRGAPTANGDGVRGGQTLRDLIKELGRVRRRSHVIAKQVVGPRRHPRSGVTHRDLKPENVIITQDHR